MIAQRLKGKLAGYWEFPGGKIEDRENPESALIREIMEEMELNIQINNYLFTIEYDYPLFHLSMKCFLCSLENDSMHLHDHSAVKWIDIHDDTDSINWVPADILVINCLKKYMR